MRDDLEMVATCGPTEAQMIQELLNNNGIECTLQGNVVSMSFQPKRTSMRSVSGFIGRTL